MPESEPREDEAAPVDPRRRWRTLPDPIPVEELTASHPSHAPVDPELGHDANHEWMLRYG
ncbi:MAG: heme biosynthesis protein HemY [Actinomycetales bacterium]|nr:heme biosynthesis protein HemY [Actinomycetales bacterium]